MHELLRKVPLFADLSDSDFENLCQGVGEVRLSAREVLFAEGSPGERAYVVKEGQLEIFKASSGREVLLGVHDPGAIIGETALIEGTPHPASVRARIDSVLLAVRKEQVDHLLSISPSAAGIIRDKAERKQAEEARRRDGEERYRKIVQHSNDAIFVIDPAEDVILDVNPKACQMLGYSREKLPSLPCSAIHPREMPLLQAFARSVFDKGHVYRCLMAFE